MHCRRTSLSCILPAHAPEAVAATTGRTEGDSRGRAGVDYALWAKQTSRHANQRHDPSAGSPGMREGAQRDMDGFSTEIPIDSLMLTTEEGRHD